ncbi:hypothetical protein EMPG_17053 [Blastomyces silverae]|uniref:Uncharacterized protein n=1 Tax=Blastomyces silverae TaxID=2060906 RepID=A0A0H1BE38_9EURO|nr:hypothetical protein EMPG_17053 [Blastomyces silverae]
MKRAKSRKSSDSNKTFSPTSQTATASSYTRPKTSGARSKPPAPLCPPTLYTSKRRSSRNPKKSPRPRRTLYHLSTSTQPPPSIQPLSWGLMSPLGPALSLALVFASKNLSSSKM